MNPRDDYQNQTEAVIARRLGKLGAMPVDTSGLDRALRKELPASPWAGRRRWVGQLVAATVVLIATIAFSTLSGREARASPAQMAQMHQDIVSGKIPTMRADSIDEANHAIAAMVGGDFPKLPQAPAAHTMACCMRNIQNKKVACVLLNDGGAPVTMVVADASQVESPRSPVQMHHGAAFHVETVGELHMVMIERESRWLCLIGAVPEGQLMDMAEAMRF